MEGVELSLSFDVVGNEAVCVGIRFRTQSRISPQDKLYVFSDLALSFALRFIAPGN
jgi:hypothetical protein